jgi:hypothetical protein
MGSLRERSPGVWQARVYNGLDPVSGKRRYAARMIHAKTRKAAETELRKLERQVMNGRVPRGTTARTFGEQLTGGTRPSVLGCRPVRRARTRRR